LRKRAQKTRSTWYRIRLALIGTTAMLFSVWLVFGDGGFWDSRGLSRVRDARAEEIALLNARKAKIQDYLGKLESGDEFAMETAARRYGLVGPNEHIYRIKVESEADSK
jgi:cell division protein FtsB